MPDTPRKVYVAHINLERSVVFPATTSSSYTASTPRGSTGTERQVSREGIKTTLRASSLEGLSQKISKYLAIVDDEDFGDDTVTRGS